MRVDLYDGRLPELPILLLATHGARDSRTEPGELEALRAALPAARFQVLDEAGHSPRSEAATAGAVTRIVEAFISVHHGRIHGR